MSNVDPSSPAARPPSPVPASSSASLPGVLDQQKRDKIIALLSNGSSRRIAARYVGCAASTITRTAARDPAFAEQIAAAEQNAEVEALRYIRTAARKDRYWRAAAWLLERKNPDDFARRPANIITQDHLAQISTQIVGILYQELPEGDWDRALTKIEEVIEFHRHEEIARNCRPQAEASPYPQLPNFEELWAEAARVHDDATHLAPAGTAAECETTGDVQHPPPVQHPPTEQNDVAAPPLSVTAATPSSSAVQQ